MFEVIFYTDKNGNSEIVDYLDQLKKESKTSKNAKINREKILAYISVLAECGTRIGEPYVKHIEGEIWELRPLKNRVFFFYWGNNTFVLLHHYVKRSQKMPPKELARAKKKWKDFMARSEKA
ncbi:MAG: type II toxin-antitoxin system RelE/ParE family toxin [Lachnospiraceae bacterium]|nr:type II toxin-antitoxin system RelE/ParE family toxin [Lachnospiraceae bacterium]